MNLKTCLFLLLCLFFTVSHSWGGGYYGPGFRPMPPPPPMWGPLGPWGPSCFRCNYGGFGYGMGYGIGMNNIPFIPYPPPIPNKEVIIIQQPTYR